MKRLLALALFLLLTACTTVAQQAITGYEAAALKSIQAANDNAIQVWSIAACGTPYSAAVRNPGIIPALKVLCLPAGPQAAPNTMFDAPDISK